MYIVERLIGVFTYVLIMFLMTFLIYKSDTRKLKKYLRIYLIILFVLAFIYIPPTSADLYRYIISAKTYSSYTISELLNVLLNARTPMQVLYFYVLGKTGIDGLIPAVSALIFYGCSFSILYKAARRYKLSNKSIAISLLFFMEMGGFLSAISIIRTSVSFAIIAYCCYNELIENKSFLKHLPWYIFAALMHPAAMAMVIFRIVTILLKKEKKLSKRLFNYLVVAVILIFVILNGNYYIDYIFEKADIYINGEVYSYIWEYIISTIYLLFSTFTIFKFKQIFTNNVEIENYTNFIIFINFILVVLCFEYSIFTRVQLFSSILFLPMFSIILNQLEKQNKHVKIFTFIFIIASALIFVIACTRGNLCGYKFLIFS